MELLVLVFLIYGPAAILVGCVAASRGRSFFGYFCIAFLFTPVIALFVLSLMGNQDNGSLSNKYHVYYCADCKEVYIAKVMRKGKCLKCKNQIIETDILEKDWKKLNDQQKEIVKRQIENGMHRIIDPASSKTAIVQQFSPADELRKYKELLDMNIISMQEFEMKKNQILGIVR